MNRPARYWSSTLVSPRALGFFLATLGAVLFAGKAIVVKITYRYGIDAVTLIAFRMLFAMPFFAAVAWRESRRAARGELPILSRRECVQLCLLGLLGYYFSSFLDFLACATYPPVLNGWLCFLRPPSWCFFLPGGYTAPFPPPRRWPWVPPTWGAP